MKKVITINFLITIFIILFLEILVRFFNIVELQGFDDKAFYQEDNIILSKPNKSFKVSGILSFTDDYGFRVPKKSFSYDLNKNFYFVLGDSVTYGVGVNEQSSFIGLQKKNNKINILNSAIFGHNLKSYLYLLKRGEKEFENKIEKVIIFLCLNDIVPYQGVVFNKNPKNQTSKTFKETLYSNQLLLKVNIFLREKSALFVLLKSIFTNPVKRHYNYMSKMYDSNENLKNFEKYIYEINKITLVNNLKVEFVLLPYAYQVKNNCAQKFLKPQNEIDKIFSNLKIKLTDYTQNFCLISNKNELFLPYDPVHLSKYGHKYVSDLLIADKIF